MKGKEFGIEQKKVFAIIKLKGEPMTALEVGEELGYRFGECSIKALAHLRELEKRGLVEFLPHGEHHRFIGAWKVREW